MYSRSILSTRPANQVISAALRDILLPEYIFHMLIKELQSSGMFSARPLKNIDGRIEIKDYN